MRWVSAKFPVNVRKCVPPAATIFDCPRAREVLAIGEIGDLSCFLLFRLNASSTVEFLAALFRSTIESQESTARSADDACEDEVKVATCTAFFFSSHLRAYLRFWLEDSSAKFRKLPGDGVCHCVSFAVPYNRYFFFSLTCARRRLLAAQMAKPFRPCAISLI